MHLKTISITIVSLAVPYSDKTFNSYYETMSQFSLNPLLYVCMCMFCVYGVFYVTWCT